MATPTSSLSQLSYFTSQWPHRTWTRVADERPLMAQSGRLAVAQTLVGFAHFALSAVWRSSLPACRPELTRDDGRCSPAGWSGVTGREALSCQSVRRRSVSDNAGCRNDTGVSRPEAVRSGLSTAGPKPHEHTGCERFAKAIHTEDNSPLGYRPERLQGWNRVGPRFRQSDPRGREQKSEN